MDGCIYRTKDGECDLYSEGGKFHAFCDMDGCEGRKLSNGDKLRAMTDEELARIIVDDWCAIVCEDTPFCDGQCESRVLDWLRQGETE